MTYNQSKWNAFLHFFQTETGRKVVFAGACTTTMSLFCINFIPQTFGLGYYREFAQCYQKGLARPVPEKVKRRIDTAIDKLEFSDIERELIKPFTVYGFDLFHAGSTKYRFGALLGIPINYAYSSTDDINRSEIRFRDEQIDWNSENGRLLQNALILTEDEQIFGFCKCLLQIRSHQILLNSIFPSVTLIMIYSVGSYINEYYKLHARPLGLRLIQYTILGLFGIGSWAFMKDFTQVRYDKRIDKKLSNMGDQFVKAGVSFYDKQLQKNMALRGLLGNDTYTAKGNVNYLLRQKSMPLTLRKSFFQKKWEELHQSKGDIETTELA